MQATNQYQAHESAYELAHEQEAWTGESALPMIAELLSNMNCGGAWEVTIAKGTRHIINAYLEGTLTHPEAVYQATQCIGNTTYKRAYTLARVAKMCLVLPDIDVPMGVISTCVQYAYDEMGDKAHRIYEQYRAVNKFDFEIQLPY